MKIEIKLKNIGKSKEEIDNYVKDMVDFAFTSSQDRCPVDTGMLKASGGVEKIGDCDYMIRYKSPYAVFCEYGTGMFGELEPPHPIKPVMKKALHWRGKGKKDIFAKSTKGMKAQPFLRPALDEMSHRFLR